MFTNMQGRGLWWSALFNLMRDQPSGRLLQVKKSHLSVFVNLPNRYLLCEGEIYPGPLFLCHYFIEVRRNVGFERGVCFHVFFEDFAVGKRWGFSRLTWRKAVS